MHASHLPPPRAGGEVQPSNGARRPPPGAGMLDSRSPPPEGARGRDRRPSRSRSSHRGRHSPRSTSSATTRSTSLPPGAAARPRLPIGATSKAKAPSYSSPPGVFERRSKHHPESSNGTVNRSGKSELPLGASGKQMRVPADCGHACGP